MARVERDLRAFRSLRAYVRGPIATLRSWEDAPSVVCGAAQAQLVDELEQLLASPDASMPTCQPSGVARISCNSTLNLMPLYVASVGVVFDAGGERLVGATLFNSQRGYDLDGPGTGLFRAMLDDGPSCP